MSIPQNTIKYCLNLGTKKLLHKKLLRNSTYLDSELLLSHAIKKSREYVLSHPKKLISEKQKSLYFQYIKRRMAYEPIAYVVGKKEFYGREFFVNNDVLVPRPATESLIENILDCIKKMRFAICDLRFADIGTGSGCIAVTLTKEIPSSTVYATDISAKALHVAKKNAKAHNAKISFYRGNILKPLKKKKIDILIANLPYLNFKEKNIYKKILKYEPRQALYAKHNGLKYYQELFRQIHEYKMFPNLMVCEILPKQRSAFKKITTDILPNYKVGFIHSAAILN